MLLGQVVEAEDDVVANVGEALGHCAARASTFGKEGMGGDAWGRQHWRRQRYFCNTKALEN